MDARDEGTMTTAVDTNVVILLDDLDPDELPAELLKKGLKAK